MIGGALMGPTGTGKTETVQGLAKCLAVPCYVYNGADYMDGQAMQHLFKGLLQVGAWVCVDHFDRIPLPILSLVATQVSHSLSLFSSMSFP